MVRISYIQHPPSPQGCRPFHPPSPETAPNGYDCWLAGVAQWKDGTCYLAWRQEQGNLACTVATGLFP